VSGSPLFLDSASVKDASRAEALGFVAGVTTNPSLMAQFADPPLEQLKSLLCATSGLVFYQPMSLEGRRIESEAVLAYDQAPERVVIKLPAQLATFEVGARLAKRGIPVAGTAIYGAAQAVVARAAEFAWLIPYVDRAERLLAQGKSLVGELRATVDAVGGDIKILGASVKTPEQVVTTLRQGADAVTCPLAVIESLVAHELTDSAVAEFARLFSLE
jgi:transaldolase